jgi:SAM-dependent methyltransferase
VAEVRLLPNKKSEQGFQANFGHRADDYARYRAGFPDQFMETLREHGIGLAGQSILDLGTGTGTLARSFAQRSGRVIGLDHSRDMLEQARQLSRAGDLTGDLDISYICATSHDTGLTSHSFDVISAGQCWHWFDKPATLAEVRRLLVPGGALLICHFDWLPEPGNVVEATAELIELHNPVWPFRHTFAPYPEYLPALSDAGFRVKQEIQLDMVQFYSHEAWRGRIRASAGVGGTLSPQAIEAFDREFSLLLKQDFPDEPLAVPHRCWAIINTVAT